MKRNVSLLAVLVLTACSTGGSGPDDRFRVSSSSKFLYATERAADSNKVVTPMNSEIVVCNGACPSHMDRVVGTPSHHAARVSMSQQGGAELSVYDLSDVKFTIADEGFAPGEKTFTFVVDESEESGTRGKIIGIDMGFDEESSFPADREPVLTRNGESIVFDGYVNDPDNNLDEDKWKPATYTYKSFGNDKFRFSDFGTLTIKRTDVEDKKRASVFIGGYDEVKKIDPTGVSATQPIEFSGTAVGSVTAILAGQGSGEAIDLNDNNAKLKLTVNNNEATSEMIANFSNWYNVDYTETGTSKTIVLSDYQGAEKYKMLTAADSEGKVTIEDIGIKTDIRYFGDNGKPSEAVGIIQVRDCNGAACTNDYGTPSDPNPEVRMNLGFGVTKDAQ